MTSIQGMRAAAAAGRETALEEAAVACDDRAAHMEKHGGPNSLWMAIAARECAAAIRKLKGDLT